MHDSELSNSYKYGPQDLKDEANALAKWIQNWKTTYNENPKLNECHYYQDQLPLLLSLFVLNSFLL